MTRIALIPIKPEIDENNAPPSIYNMAPLFIIIAILATYILIVLQFLSVKWLSAYSSILGNLREGGSNKIEEDGRNIEEMIKDNFADEAYAIDRDAHISEIVGDDEQWYLNHDYSKNLKYVPILFGRDTIAPPNGKSREEMNRIIMKAYADGKGTRWDNQTISYAKKNIPGKQQHEAIHKHTITKLLGFKSARFADITANIGNDSFIVGLSPWVDELISYEMQEKPFKMLEANAALYGLKKQTLFNEKYESGEKLKFANEDAKNGQCTAVIVDPPFELGNNPDNFNFSVAAKPIEYVINDLLERDGVDVVFMSVPLNYRYNLKFAADYGHRCSVYYIGSKNIKIYVVGKNLKLRDKKFYRIVTRFDSDAYKLVELSK
jgi:hypothetical protein